MPGQRISYFACFVADGKEFDVAVLVSSAEIK
jgi:hypothetical protein